MACLEITLKQMQNCFCLAKFMNQGIYHPKNLSIQSNFYKKAYLSLYLFVFLFSNLMIKLFSLPVRSIQLDGLNCRMKHH